MANIFEQLGDVDPSALSAVRERIGVPLRIEQFNHSASYDAIRHYAMGIGDDNPLWCDEQYGSRSRYGGTVAPPTFFYSVFQGGTSFGFPGMQPFHGRSRWRWHRLARLGEEIVASAQLVDVQEKRGRTASRLVIQTGETEYRTRDGELLAVHVGDVLRIPRVGREGALTYEPREQRVYTEEELRGIEREVLAEERRGATPRYWEDVEVGDEIPAVVKGPLDQVDMTCYYAGVLGTSGYKAFELRWRQRHYARTDPDRLPNNYDLSYFSEFVLPSLGHLDSSVAHAVGMPGAYDNGPMRIGWMAHLMTNWIGDDGFLESLDVRIARPNMFGNTTWCSGVVVTKAIDENGCAIVDIDLRGVTQDGETNTTGSARARLPRRSADEA